MSRRLPSAVRLVSRTLALPALLAAACVGVPPPTPMDLRLDYPDVRVLTPQWRRLVVDPEARSYRPVERSGVALDPAGGRVFVGTSQGRFLALDSGTGEVLWVHREPDGFHSPALLLTEPEAVVAGNDDGALVAMSADDGAVLWRTELGGTIRTGAAFSEGVLYVRTTTQRVFAIEALSGRDLWSFERPVPEGYASAGESGVLVAGDRVVTGFVDGQLVALSAVTGEKLWELNLAGEGYDELLLDDICTTPALAGDTVVASSYDNGVFGIDLESGVQVWGRTDLTHVSGLAALGEDVLAAVAGGGLARLDALDGTTVWIRRFPAGTLRDPVTAGGLILVADDMHGLLVFETLTGMLIEDRWPGAGVAGRPAVEAGRVGVLDSSGELLSFFLPAGVP